MCDSISDNCSSIGYPATKTKIEHIPKYCQIKNCTNEAGRWIEDEAWPDNTFYFCLEHAEEDEDFMSDTAGQFVEVAVYSCSEQCAECNQ